MTDMLPPFSQVISPWARRRMTAERPFLAVRTVAEVLPDEHLTKELIP